MNVETETFWVEVNVAEALYRGWLEMRDAWGGFELGQIDGDLTDGFTATVFSTASMSGEEAQEIAFKQCIDYVDDMMYAIEGSICAYATGEIETGSHGTMEIQFAIDYDADIPDYPLTSDLASSKV